MCASVFYLAEKKIKEKQTSNSGAKSSICFWLFANYFRWIFFANFRVLYCYRLKPKAMRFIKLISILIFLTTALQLKAWDEVTHAYMTRMIPELVEDAELKQLLKNNLDEYIYGSWYTDTYQYTGKSKRINTLNPHIISIYGPAFMNYLQKENVMQQDNYEKLVALYLGSLSHLIEDFWYDSNLNKYQKTKSDKYQGDARHGAFVAKQNGYIDIKVKHYFPAKDLFEMYREAGLLEPEYDTLEKFEKLMNSWSNQQYLMLRSLKFLNFLGGNQMYNQSLWTAANLKEINGGMLNSAEVAAKFIESTWNQLKNRPVQKILHANYFEFENKIAVLTSDPSDLNEIKKQYIYLLNSVNDTIAGEIKQFEHSDKKKGITKYAFSFYPNKQLKTNSSYKLYVSSKTGDTSPLFAEPYVFEFTPGIYIEKLAKPKPFLNTIGLGIFGFIPLFAIAGLLFGIGGIIRFKWHLKNRNIKLPLYLLATQHLLQIAATIVIIYGFYILATRGEIILELAL